MVGKIQALHKKKIEHRHLTINQKKNNNQNRLEHERRKSTARISLGIGTWSNTPNNKVRMPKQNGQNQNRQITQIVQQMKFTKQTNTHHENISLEQNNQIQKHRKTIGRMSIN